MTAGDPSTDALACLDNGGNPRWTCVEYDGTGLWCDGCLTLDALWGLFNPSETARGAE